MKRWMIVPVLLLMLTGCRFQHGELERAMDLRARLLAGECSFDAVITADYGDMLHSFTMNCRGDSKGNVSFTVTKPDSISGICGTVTEDGGKLEFDGTALVFELMADGQVSPVSAPWLLLKTLRGGYLTACGMEGELLRLTIDDSYEEDALHLEIWLDGDDSPVRGEVYWDGRRILTVEVEKFAYQSLSDAGRIG